jgi:hypothetical protein
VLQDSLLKTKLHIPPVRPELVSCPRLLERLDEGLQRRLTLVSEWVNGSRLDAENISQSTYRIV